MRYGECDVISLYLCVSLLIVCCVFDSVCDCLVKQFAICLGVVVILLLNVIEVFCVWGVLCCIDRVWSST